MLVVLESMRHVEEALDGTRHVLKVLVMLMALLVLVMMLAMMLVIGTEARGRRRLESCGTRGIERVLLLTLFRICFQGMTSGVV